MPLDINQISASIKKRLESERVIEAQEKICENLKKRREEEEKREQK